MLYMSQAFLSQLFSKKQMLPRAARAGRRTLKRLCMCWRAARAALKPSVHSHPGTQMTQHLVGGRAMLHPRTILKSQELCCCLRSKFLANSERLHWYANSLQNCDVQAQHCGYQTFANLDVDAWGSVFSISLSAILNNIFWAKSLP